MSRICMFIAVVMVLGAYVHHTAQSGATAISPVGSSSSDAPKVTPIKMVLVASTVEP